MFVLIIFDQKLYSTRECPACIFQATISNAIGSKSTIALNRYLKWVAVKLQPTAQAITSNGSIKFMESKRAPRHWLINSAFITHNIILLLDANKALAIIQFYIIHYIPYLNNR